MPKRLALGIDIGGTGIKMGFVDRNGRLGQTIRFPTPAKTDPRTMADLISRQARALLAPKSRSLIKGIGVGVAGDINPVTGVIRLSPNLGWRNAPFKALLTRQLHYPIRIDNDANVAAWGAYVLEAKRKVKSLLCVMLGTGVGGGIVLDGKLFRGSTGSAGEIGHMTLYPDGIPCGCGNQGCLERYIGANAMAEAAKRAIETGLTTTLTRMVKGDISKITPLLIYEAARKGDRMALQLYEQAGERLGIGLASVINFMNPDWIVLAGGLSRAGRYILNPLRRTLKKRAFPTPLKAVRLIVSSKDQDLGMIGAGLIAHE